MPFPASATWLGACAKKSLSWAARSSPSAGPDGYVYDPDGIVTEEKIAYLLEMRASGRDKAQDYADKFGCASMPSEKPWGVKVDVCMPCATQNEIDMEEAKKIVANGVPSTTSKWPTCPQPTKHWST